MSSPVVVAPDPGWPAQFEAERAILASALEPWLSGGVHHIGSTAVPDLPAKPIIDMMAGLGALVDADDSQPILAGHGYERRVHRVDAALLVKAIGDRDAYSLQLTVVGSDLWRERLTFRDALRADPALVAEYAQLKARLVRERGGRIYAAPDKREFVRRVLADAGMKLRDDRHATRPH